MLSMFNQALAGLFALYLGAGGVTASPVTLEEAPRCEIRATTESGMVALQGVFRADAATTGSYGFHVVGSGGGNSRINQGGGFSAKAGEEVALGTVMLGANSRYEVSLTVTAVGETLECAERI
ncbi:MAG: curli-like amyloid fiber formation chaperone CsgH [Rhizobiaceae bacterium]